MSAKSSLGLSLLLFAVAHGGVDFYVCLLQALAPSLAARLDIPLGTVVAVVGVGQLVNNCIQPLAGLIMGKRNLSWILWFGAVLAVFPAFMGLTAHFAVVALLVLLGSIGTGIFHPEGLLAAHDASGTHAHVGVPLFMACGYFFSAAAAPVAIYWVEHLGFPSLAWLTAPGLCIAVGLFILYRRKRRSHPSVVLRPRSRRQTRIEAGNYSVWPLLGVCACTSVATGLFMAILTSHYELAYGPDSRIWAGWVLLALGGGGVLASFFWGQMTRRRGYYLIVAATQVAAAPLFAWLAYAGTPAEGLAIVIPLSLISPGAVYPAAVTLVRNASGLTQSLRAGLVVGGTWGVASVVIMIAGWLLARGMSSANLVLISAAACLVAACIGGWQLVTGGRNVGKAAHTSTQLQH